MPRHTVSELTPHTRREQENPSMNTEYNNELNWNIDTSNVLLQEKIEEDIYTSANTRMTKDNLESNSRGAWSESKIGSRYVSSAQHKFTEALVSFLSRKSGGRGARAAEYLRQTGLNPEVISYLYVKQVYNLIPLFSSKPIKRTSFCIKSVDAIHTEWRLSFFGSVKERKNLLDKITKDMDKRTYPTSWRMRTYRMYFDAEQVEWRGWSQRECLLIGYALMTLFMEATKLIEADHTKTYVLPTQELVDHVEQTCKRSVLDFTLYLPMVVKPRAWSAEYNLFKGGYMNRGRVKKYSIIKGAGKRDVERMLRMDWERILPPINAIQETPWRVKRRMVDALDYVFNELGGDRGGLPTVDAIELPPKPPKYDTDEEVRKAHNKDVFLIRDQNRQDISKRLSVVFTLSIARKFQQFHQIFFPHNLDVRGRAYPLPAFLNPQAADFGKSMLEFADGVAIENMEQAAWLAVAGANAWGNDKVSLQDRADWVVANEEWIIECGRDWRNNQQWLDADEPFMFLSFAMEWADLIEADKRGEVFYSHFPCHVDATCSGLQHYSAMLRDEVGGRSVNLIPGLDRQDIYADVAEVTKRMLVADGSPEAMLWINFGVDRKMTKRQTMVIPYAGKFSSCMTYTREAYVEKLKAGHQRLWDAKQDGEMVVLLSRYIWAAIDEVVVKAKVAMDWLSSTAREWTKYHNKLECSAYDKRMTWTTPDGFQVVQYRASQKLMRQETYMNGRVQLTYYNDTVNLDAKDMALSVAPNFVHSLDASHLRMAVLAGTRVGIGSFAMIHDSFGVHAAHMPDFLEKCVKPSFIDMYVTRDPLHELYVSLPFEHDIPPSKGSLEINGVSDSEFFFS